MKKYLELFARMPLLVKISSVIVALVAGYFCLSFLLFLADHPVTFFFLLIAGVVGFSVYTVVTWLDKNG